MDDTVDWLEGDDRLILNKKKNVFFFSQTFVFTHEGQFIVEQPHYQLCTCLVSS